MEVDENKNAADLGSTKEWTQHSTARMPLGSTSHPGLRSEIEANEIEIGKGKKQNRTAGR
jgi:hypothetical protein